MNKRFLIIAFFPIIIFLVLGSVLMIGLSRNDDLPSNLVGKMAPPLPQEYIEGYDPIPKDALLEPTIKIVNFFASWCAPCRAEHPLLMELSRQKNLKILGVNFKDKKINASNFLKSLGNPYHYLAKDEQGKQSVNFGIYGIPESILIDKEFTIIKKFVGPLNIKDLNEIKTITNSL